MTDTEYAVGYGKPPRQHQYRSGQSGNPMGRPRRTIRLNQVVTDVVNSPITIQENGCDKTVTRLEAVLLSLVKKSLAGDMRAASLLLKVCGPAEEHAVREENEYESRLSHAAAAAERKLRKKENDHLKQKPPCVACDEYIMKYLKERPIDAPINLTGYNGHSPEYLAEVGKEASGQSLEEIWSEIERLEKDIVKWHDDVDPGSNP